MPQISSLPAASHRRRGVTFIEMCVIVTVLLIMAALVGRNFSRIKEGQDERTFIAGLNDAVKRAKVTAISDGKTVTLKYDTGQSQITLNEPTTDTSDPSQFVPLTELQNQQPQPIHTLSVPETITFTEFRLGTNSTDATGWQINFYPDGRSDGGGVQLSVDGKPESLVIDQNGRGTFSQDALPDTSNDVWQAGQIVFRSSTSTGP